MEMKWLGNKTVCYFRFRPKDGEVPINKDAVSHTACLDPDRRSRGNVLRTEKSVNELVEGMTEGILQMERWYIYCENIPYRVAAQIGPNNKHF
jgi:hypothetical protein